MQNKIYRRNGYYYIQFDKKIERKVIADFLADFSYFKPSINLHTYTRANVIIYELDITPEIADKLKTFAKQFNFEIDIEAKNVIVSKENRR